MLDERKKKWLKKIISTVSIDNTGNNEEVAGVTTFSTTQGGEVASLLRKNPPATKTCRKETQKQRALQRPKVVRHQPASPTPVETHVFDAETAELIEWFQSDPKLPMEPFQLDRHLTISNPAKWYEALRRDIEAGPDSVRVRNGDLKRHLRQLRDMTINSSLPLKSPCQQQIQQESKTTTSSSTRFAENTPAAKKEQ